MKKFKKWMYIALIFVITGTVLFLYISFNSTFIAKWKAKQIALAYLDEVFEEDYTYERTSYTFIDKSYYVRFKAPVPTGEFNGTVEVGGGLWPKDILYIYSNNASPDPDQDERINDVATEQLRNVLNDFPLAEAYYAIASPTVFGYTAETFSIFETHTLPPSISIYLTNENRMLDDVIQLTKHIQQTLTNANVYYEDFYVYQNPSDSNPARYTLKATKNAVEVLK